MSEDRIRHLADDLAAALCARDVEQYRSIFESMTDAEAAASHRPVVDALLRLTHDRQAQLMDALKKAGTDYDVVQSVIDSMSADDRDLIVMLTVLRAAHLEQGVLDDLDLELECLDFPGGGGPFMFRTDEELLSVVKVSMRAAFTELPCGPKSAEDREAIEADLEALLSDAEKRAKTETLNRGFVAVPLSTRWTPKLGRKTHAGVIPSDSSYQSYSYGGTRCETLCARGWGDVPSLRPTLEVVDCPGCLNALALGGFLRRDEEHHGAGDA